MDKVFENNRAAGVAFMAAEHTHHLQLPPYFAVYLGSIFIARTWVPDPHDDGLPSQGYEIDREFCRNTLSLLMADTFKSL